MCSEIVPSNQYLKTDSDTKFSACILFVYSNDWSRQLHSGVSGKFSFILTVLHITVAFFWLALMTYLLAWSSQGSPWGLLQSVVSRATSGSHPALSPSLSPWRTLCSEEWTKHVSWCVHHPFRKHKMFQVTSVDARWGSGVTSKIRRNGYHHENNRGLTLEISKLQDKPHCWHPSGFFFRFCLKEFSPFFVEMFLQPLYTALDRTLLMCEGRRRKSNSARKSFQSDQ